MFSKKWCLFWKHEVHVLSRCIMINDRAELRLIVLGYYDNLTACKSFRHSRVFTLNSCRLSKQYVLMESFIYYFPHPSAIFHLSLFGSSTPMHQVLCESVKLADCIIKIIKIYKNISDT